MVNTDYEAVHLELEKAFVIDMMEYKAYHWRKTGFEGN